MYVLKRPSTIDDAFQIALEAAFCILAKLNNLPSNQPTASSAERADINLKLPLIKKIIELFGETKTPWALAAWFGSPNSWLNNAKPKDLLTSNPERVLEAAQRTKEGPIHG